MHKILGDIFRILQSSQCGSTSDSVEAGSFSITMLLPVQNDDDLKELEYLLEKNETIQLALVFFLLLFSMDFA